MTPFTLTPTRCQVTYACTSVARVDSSTSTIDCDDLTFDTTTGSFTFSADSDDYKSGDFIPGTYTVTITGTAVGSSPLKDDTTTMSFTLVDPCDPPTSITKAEFVN